MAFVEREAGVIVGAYHVKQPGRAEEFLADDHVEVIAFRTRAEPEDPKLTALKNATSTTEVRDAVVALFERS